MTFGNSTGNLGQGFNVNELPESEGGDFSTIPAGTYQASITQSRLETTKAGTGQYIKMRFDITGPTHAGRVLFCNLNIRNPSAKAEQIGLQQLNELMRAIGLASVTDTDQLLGHNLQINVSRPKEDNPQYADADGFRNDIKGFKSMSGSAAPMPQAAAPAPAAQAAPAAATPPWG